MSLNRWKVLACTLTVGVGGLAVFATDPAPKSDAPKEPAPLPNLTVKPISPANGTDTAAPVIPVKGEEFELTVPVPPAPLKTDEPLKIKVDQPVKKRSSEPVFEAITPPAPAIIIPVKGEAEPQNGKKPAGGTKDDVPTIEIPPVPAKSENTAPPVPIILPASGEAADKDVKKPEPAKKEETPVITAPPIPTKPELVPPSASTPPVIEVPKTPATKPPVDLPVPDLKRPADDTPPPPTGVSEASPKFGSERQKGVPTPPTAPVAAPRIGTEGCGDSAEPPRIATPKTEGAKLKMLLRMGDGQPRFEIRNNGSTDLLLKVYGEKIELQGPSDGKSTLAGVSAVGHVRFTAPGIEGTCDQLTILSGTGELLLKGNIHLKNRRGKAWSELTAEKMVYQIGTTGLASSAVPRVTPAAYLPD
jgi:hypothetical protein